MDKLTQSNTYASLNGAEEAVSNMFGGSYKMIGLVIVAVVLLVLIYFIYQKMNGEEEEEEDVKPVKGKPKAKVPEPVKETKEPQKELISMSSSESDEQVDDNAVW